MKQNSYLLELLFARILYENSLSSSIPAKKSKKECTRNLDRQKSPIEMKYTNIIIQW